MTWSAWLSKYPEPLSSDERNLTATRSRRTSTCTHRSHAQRPLLVFQSQKVSKAALSFAGSTEKHNWSNWSSPKDWITLNNIALWLYSRCRELFPVPNFLHKRLPQGKLNTKRPIPPSNHNSPEDTSQSTKMCLSAHRHALPHELSLFFFSHRVCFALTLYIIHRLGPLYKVWVIKSKWGIQSWLNFPRVRKINTLTSFPLQIARTTQNNAHTVWDRAKFPH